MIDTFQIYARPNYSEKQDIKKHFQPNRIKDAFVWTLTATKGISMKYLMSQEKRISLLQMVVNPALVLEKRQIVNDDYASIVTAIDRILALYCGRMRVADFNLSRIDYKLDIVTPYKDIYVGILKQLQFSYRRKHQQEWMTSVYYNGKSYTINLYDKEAKEGASFKDVLRLELQLKSRWIRRQFNEYGMVASLRNYFNDSVRRNTFEDLLTPLIYRGDHYTIRKSRYVLAEYGYSEKTVTKLLDFQRLVLQHGMSASTRLSGKSANTVRGYIVKLQNAGVNPVPLPHDCRVNHLPGLLTYLGDVNHKNSSSVNEAS